MSKMRRSVALLSVLLLMAACGSGTKAAGTVSTTAAPAPTTTSTTAAPINYGQKYLAVIGPFDNEMHAITSTYTPTQLQGVANDLTMVEGSLLAVSWPGQTETDVKTLITDIGTLAGAVAIDEPAQVTTADGAVSAASATVRHDLGLPSNPDG